MDSQTTPPPWEASAPPGKPRRWLRPFGFPRSFVASFGVHAVLIAAAVAVGLGPRLARGRVYFNTAMAFERPESSQETWVTDVEPPREPEVEEPPEPDVLPVEPLDPEPVPEPLPEPDLADPADMTQVWARVSLDPLRRLDPPEIEDASSAPVSPSEVAEPVQVAEAATAVPEPQVTGPELLYHPPPTYPESARRLGQEGVVVLNIQVSAAGRVLEVEVSESSGFRLLDRAAVQAVRKWKFRPALENGLPVASLFEHPIRFVLTAS